MKSRDDLLAGIAAHLRQLKDDSLPPLDFDALVATLEQAKTALAQDPPVSDELSLLRRDYCERISGMLKAIAAVRRSPEALEAATDEIDQLAGLSVQELITRYRKVSARFRDAFPTSFGFTQAGRSGSVHRHLNDYK